MTIQGPDYTSKTDLVAALIRKLIITGELATGEQLRQRDLARRFSVSQTPVREAMRRLESEGLLRSDTHRGFTVVAPDVPGCPAPTPSPPGSTTRSWPRSPRAIPTPLPLGHISTSWARIR